MIMVVYSVEGVQNLSFKIKPTHFSILIPTPLKNPTTEQISGSERMDRVGFQDKQIRQANDTYSEIKLLSLQTTLYASWETTAV